MRHKASRLLQLPSPCAPPLTTRKHIRRAAARSVLRGPHANRTQQSAAQPNDRDTETEIMNRSMFAMVALVMVAGCQTEETSPTHETFTLVSADARNHIQKIAYGETAGPIRASGFGYSFLQFDAKAG